MSEPIKHHFVSRCYLKAFGFGNKSSRRLRVIELTAKSQRTSHLKDIAESENFNRLELKGKSPTELEHELASIEMEAAPALDKLRKERKLSHEGLDAAVCFMAMFATRSPFVRKLLSDKLADQGTSQINNITLEESKWESLETGIPYEHASSIIEMLDLKVTPSRRLVVGVELISLIKLSSSLLTRYWTILDAQGSGNEFITSDRPVAIVDISGNNEGKDGSDIFSRRPEFDDKDTLVHFPLSPTLALQGAFAEFEYGSVDSELVAGTNAIMMKQAGKELYFHGRNFNILDDQCEMHDKTWILEGK